MVPDVLHNARPLRFVFIQHHGNAVVFLARNVEHATLEHRCHMAFWKASGKASSEWN